MTSWKTRGTLAFIALAFVATGMLFASRMGIEVDEAIVSEGIYPHGEAAYSWNFGGNTVPIMLINYLGALKTWFYNALFLLTPPRPISLRLPMLIAAALALTLFFVLVDRTVGRRAAWIGTLLFATDTSYLLLSALDFGPVVVQFVLKLGALLLLLNFYRTGSKVQLAGGFFLLGLALWDKAVFIWLLFGLTLAVVAVFPRELRQRLTLANIGVAAAGMLVGAFPLVVYNVAHPLETFRSNGHLDPGAIPAKVKYLSTTMDGYVLFGFVTGLEPGLQPGQPRHWYQSASIAVDQLASHPYHNLTVFAFAGSVLSLPLLWRSSRKPILFGLVACAATWILMVLTAGGGGGAAHHVVLLWPFHFLVIAAALSRVRLAPAVAVTALLCGSSLVVTNHYYADLIRNGPAIRWTDAMDPLQQYLRNLPAPRIFATDWGFVETMNLLSQGELPMFQAPVNSDEGLRFMLADPDNAFVGHVPGFTYLPEERAALENFARREGYQEENIAVIRDRNGRPTFDVFRFHKT